MAEKAIFYARAVVYYFDPKTKGWTPTAVGTQFCRIDMYENTQTNSFRVIGRGLQDTSKVVINSNITKETQYTRASETFHQWSDNRYIYGLNYPTKEEAEAFGTGFEQTVNKLKSGGGSPPPPPGPPQPPTPPSNTGTTMRGSSSTISKPTSSNEDSSPPGPPGPPPPPAPKVTPRNDPPPTSSGGDGGGRGDLLASITGFKGGLKKVNTVDKSAPILTKESESKSSSGGGGGGVGGMMAEMLNARKKIVSNPSTPVKKEASNPPPQMPKQTLTPTKQSLPSSNSRSGSVSSKDKDSHMGSSSSYNNNNSSSSSGSHLSNQDLVTLKEEILSEVRKELEKMKEEILAAIHNR